MNDILIARDSKNKIRIVEISCQIDNNVYVLKRKTYQYSGKISVQPDIVIDQSKAKRTLLEQATLVYNSHVKKYLDKGYKRLFDLGYTSLDECNIEQIVPSEITDQNGFQRPMLAKPHKECAISIFERDFYASRKIDGVRCLTHFVNGQIVTSSRGGNDYNVSAHYVINNPKLIEFFKEHPDYSLDGELYIHGRSLAYISGLCRLQTLNEKHKELKYYIYDVAVEKLKFSERLDILNELSELFDDSDPIVIVEHILVNSWYKIKKLHDKFVNEGWEGCVIRNPDKEYGFNRRDNRMIKIKEFDDSEFEIVGIAEGLRPEDFCFVLKTSKNQEFKAKPIGDRKLKDWYRSNINSLIGKYGTVKYFGLTPYGIPNLPTFINVRDDVMLM